MPRRSVGEKFSQTGKRRRRRYFVASKYLGLCTPSRYLKHRRSAGYALNPRRVAYRSLRTVHASTAKTATWGSWHIDACMVQCGHEFLVQNSFKCQLRSKTDTTDNRAQIQRLILLSRAIPLLHVEEAGRERDRNRRPHYRTRRSQRARRCWDHPYLRIWRC